MPTTKRKPPPQEGQAGKPGPVARARPDAPQIEQRHWDLIGLGLVAFSVFLGFVLYRGPRRRRARREDGRRPDVADGRHRLRRPGRARRHRRRSSSCARSCRPSSRSARGGLCLLAAALLWLGADRGGRVGRARRGERRRAGRRLRRRRPGDLLLPRRGAAAHRRLDRRRPQGDEHERRRHDARRCGPCEAARPRVAARPSRVHEEPTVTRIVDDPQEQFPDLFEDDRRRGAATRTAVAPRGPDPAGRRGVEDERAVDAGGPRRHAGDRRRPRRT